MDDLTFNIKELCKRNPHGSKSTQANRHRQLSLIARQIGKAGYKLPSASSLKPKHITTVLTQWKSEGLSTGTIKNRMAAVRWWAKSINKTSILKSNEEYGIEDRKQGNENKAQKLDMSKLGRIKSPHIKMAVRLQAAFGLRREEALKFNPVDADRGDRIALKPSTTKGGRYREIEITSDRQRVLLEEAKALAEGGSLIPKDRKYIEHLKDYENQTLKAGLRNNHGLRHNWAQIRYEQLTGMKPPVKGGPSKAEMTDEQWQLDREARQDLAEEMGHSRIDITDNYLGKAALK